METEVRKDQKKKKKKDIDRAERVQNLQDKMLQEMVRPSLSAVASPLATFLHGSENNDSKSSSRASSVSGNSVSAPSAKETTEEMWLRLMERREARRAMKEQEEKSLERILVEMEESRIRMEEQRLQLEEQRLKVEAQKAENNRKMFEILLQKINHKN